jgi:hypothetical protein
LHRARSSRSGWRIYPECKTNLTSALRCGTYTLYSYHQFPADVKHRLNKHASHIETTALDNLPVFVYGGTKYLCGEMSTISAAGGCRNAKIYRVSNETSETTHPIRNLQTEDRLPIVAYI